MKLPASRRLSLLPPTTRVDVQEIPATASLLAALREQLRAQLLSRHGRELSAHWVNQSVQEAEALACQTPIPLLVLPELAREKVATRHLWLGRQQEIRARGILSFAA